MDNLRFGSQLHPAVGSHLLIPCPTKFTAAPARCGDLISRWPLPREFREGNTESAQAMERQWKLYVSECVDLCSACMGCGREVVKGQLSSGLGHTSLSLAQSRTKEDPPTPKSDPKVSLAFSLRSFERSGAQGVSVLRAELSSFLSAFSSSPCGAGCPLLASLR